MSLQKTSAPLVGVVVGTVDKGVQYERDIPSFLLFPLFLALSVVFSPSSVTLWLLALHIEVGSFEALKGE